MVKFIVGAKGEGKTKKLIEMANSIAKETDGHLVFIDNNKSHIYDLHYDIRFVQMESFHLSNYREFIGFICGVLSQDSDIKEIFVDGIKDIIKTFDDEALVKLISKLENLSLEHSVNFIIGLNCDQNKIPEEVKNLLV